eukprot:6070211-Amphidinium_carterae.1
MLGLYFASGLVTLRLSILVSGQYWTEPFQNQPVKTANEAIAINGASLDLSRFIVRLSTIVPHRRAIGGLFC